MPASKAKRSLRQQLLIAVAVVLAIFFSIAIAILDSAFRNAAMQSEQEQLDIHLFSLLAGATTSSDNRLTLEGEMGERRFATPGSGLYATVFNNKGKAVWSSQSTLGQVIPWLNTVEVGARKFQQLELANGDEILSYSLAVNWLFDDNSKQTFSFHVAENLDSYYAQVNRFRRKLFGWFGGIAIGFMVFLGVVLRRVLRPLRQIEHEITAVEQGQRERLSRNYPTELTGVARNLNGLIDRERNRGDVYRRTLGDLAHSLKTPLATLKSLLDNKADESIDKELTRIDEIIRYQLAKPSTRGRTIGSQPVDVGPLVKELLASFDKIYHEKQVQIDCDVESGLVFRGDRGDLLELIGNILDNAYKRCAGKVRLNAHRHSDGNFSLSVEDDGPGFPSNATAQLLERGQRLDEAPHSQGIGLAIVAEILSVYQADMQLDRAELGGARVQVVVPAQ